MNILADFKQQFNRQDNAVIKILLINLIVFVITGTISVFEAIARGPIPFLSALVDWLAMPYDPMKFLIRIWSPVTYMFLHAGIWHIISNSIIFYVMGRIFLDFFGGRKLIGLYLMGGIVGGFVSFLAAQLFPHLIPHQGSLVGASAAIFAIIGALPVLLPTYTINIIFIGPVNIKWIAFVLIFVFSFLQIPGGNAGGMIAHLGGAGLGYLYATQLQRGTNIAEWVSQALDAIEEVLGTKQRGKMKVTYRNQATAGNRSRTKTKKKSKGSSANPSEIDRILDKINKSGYKSLTKEEKQILFQASQKDGGTEG